MTQFSSNLFIKLLLDGCYSILIVTNIVIFVWRSIWDLQDYYLTNNLCLNYWISLLLSYVVIIIVKIAQRRFYRRYRKIENTDYYEFKRRFDPNDYNIDFKNKNKNTDYSDEIISCFELNIYIVLFAFANINHWRGIWFLTTYYTNDSHYGIFWIGLVSFFGLWMMKRVNSLMSTPFQINSDCIEIAFKIQPENLLNYDNTGTYVCMLVFFITYKSFFNNYFFFIKIYLPKWQYFSNFLSEYVTDIFTIQLWRSLWCLLDKHLYPSNQLYSSLICLASGIVGYSIVYSFKGLLNKHLCKNREKESQSSIKEFKLLISYFQKLILLRLVIVVNFILVVCIWRGIWNLQYSLVYINEPNLQTRIIICLTSICLSLIILLLLNRVSAILSRGNCKDEIFFLKDKYIIIETLSQGMFSSLVRF